MAMAEGAAIIESAARRGTTTRSGLSPLTRAEYFIRVATFHRDQEAWSELATTINNWGRIQNRRRRYLRALFLIYSADLASIRDRPAHANVEQSSSFFSKPPSAQNMTPHGRHSGSRSTKLHVQFSVPRPGELSPESISPFPDSEST